MIDYNYLLTLISYLPLFTIAILMLCIGLFLYIILFKRKIKQERKFKQEMLNVLASSIIWIDRKGVITERTKIKNEVNIGIKKEDIVGKSFELFFNNIPKIKSIKKAIDEILISHEPKTVKTTVVDFSGKLHHLIINMIYYNDNNIACHIYNLSHKYEVGNRIREINHYYKDLLDNLPIALSIKNSDRKYLYINKEASKLFNINPTKIIGMSYEAFENTNDRESFKKYDNKILETKKNFSVMENFFLNDKKEHSFSINKTLINYKNEVRILSTIIDLTPIFENKQKLRLLNKKYRLIMQAANILNWVFNPKTEELAISIDLNTGTSTPENIVYHLKDVLPLIHPEYKKLIFKMCNLLLENKKEKVKFAIKALPHKNAKYNNWYEIYGTILTMENIHQDRLIVGALKNINDEKISEHKLEQSKQKAEEANLLKSAFLANISHEIRTPLNAIVGFSSLLPHAKDTKERNDYIKIIDSNNQLLLQLINDIIDLSKLESGTWVFNYEETDVPLLLEEVKERYKLRNSNKEIQICVSQHTAPVIAYIDRDRVLQVLHNLMDNAIKFTHKGYIELECVADNNTLTFHVKDTGCGIARKDKKYVFDRFTKLNSFTQGTGLGLSISKAIIKKLNGEIGVHSEPNMGSTFWFKIPNGGNKELAYKSEHYLKDLN